MKIELLSPAKNTESGIAAIDYGADAVYIGALKFGARVNAGNSFEDIQKLIEYAHKFNVKVYPVLNTIIYDHELPAVREMINRLYQIKADAIIVQDMGILEMEIPPIPLFASTQTHNYDLDRIKFLDSVGFSRIILARELSMDMIKKIRQNCQAELEFFIHGALCVSFSGQCYFSEAVVNRSGNRGECSQPCRMKYNLLDANGNVLLKNKNILSLKDLNLSGYISELIDAGISSFKIEGRLKDISYVKNITAYYRILIDEALKQNSSREKSSSGSTNFNFIPDPLKSFNRSFTDYYINKKRNRVASINSEKSLGEIIGKVKSINNNFIIIDSDKKLNNGDGICFFDNDILYGTNINIANGNKIYLNNPEHLKPGALIYRNYDTQFDKFLSKNRLKRKLKLSFRLYIQSDKLHLTGTDEDNYSFNSSIDLNNYKSGYTSTEKIETQLKKSGESIFEVTSINIESEIHHEIPVKALNELRRSVTIALENFRIENYKNKSIEIIPNSIPYPEAGIDYKTNVTNSKAEGFYKRHGVKTIESGFELQKNRKNKEIMRTKYCIRYEIGKCPVIDKTHDASPLYLENNNKKYRVEFDCKECMMKIILE